MPRETRPTNRGDAIRLIKSTFRFNRWGEDEINRYLRTLKFGDTNWKEFSNDDLRKILDDFEQAKMILFEEKVNEYSS